MAAACGGHDYSSQCNFLRNEGFIRKVVCSGGVQVKSAVTGMIDLMHVWCKGVCSVCVCGGKVLTDCVCVQNSVWDLTVCMCVQSGQ